MQIRHLDKCLTQSVAGVTLLLLNVEESTLVWTPSQPRNLRMDREREREGEGGREWYDLEIVLQRDSILRASSS